MEERITAALASDRTETVELKLSKIPQGYPGREKVAAHLTELKKRDAVVLKKQAATQAANFVIARREYVKALREKFLDEGMDIKVSASGSTATQLNLKYTLFNDVWVHKFKKGALCDEISRMGFKKVDFNNGYDYHVMLTFQ
ncbi:MAG: hypothetical protein JW725_05625 [Candidatus Babeliaceae bacterium]|nr:hypothetical protein [Candidatus Babeliaceae bacterium]